MTVKGHIVFYFHLNFFQIFTLAKISNIHYNKVETRNFKKWGREMEYKLRVPITHYQDIKLGHKDLVEVLEQEKKKLAGRWDCIVKRNDGTAYYYNRGYGSHDIGEEDGPDVSPEVLEDYNTVNNMISYLQRKIAEKVKS
jgi:hypothetical protein